MKSLFEQMGSTYREENGYLIPNLILPEEEQSEIGVWGQRHLEYIEHHRKGFYTALIFDCKVNRYLADINNQAEEMFDALIKQFKQTEGITEKGNRNCQRRIDFQLKMNCQTKCNTF